MSTTLFKLNKKTKDAVNDAAVVSEKKVRKQSVKKAGKVKRDWRLIVHKACRICIFRTLEAVLAFLTTSILVLVIGSMFVPTISYSMASSAGITQGTDMYTAMALWLLPMLFFVLLVTAGTFCVLRMFLKWLHRHFSNVIRKGNEKDLAESEAAR